VGQQNSIQDWFLIPPPPTQEETLIGIILPPRYNISQLEEWCRSHGLVESGVMDQLQPIIQAAKLLQMKKSNEEDVETICELCSKLNPLQVCADVWVGVLGGEFSVCLP